MSARCLCLASAYDGRGPRGARRVLHDAPLFHSRRGRLRTTTSQCSQVRCAFFGPFGRRSHDVVVPNESAAHTEET
eukprot:4811117-Prymnesium_polylepis.2